MGIDALTHALGIALDELAAPKKTGARTCVRAPKVGEDRPVAGLRAIDGTRISGPLSLRLLGPKLVETKATKKAG